MRLERSNPQRLARMKMPGVSSAQRYDCAKARTIDVVSVPPTSTGPRGSPRRFAAVSTAMKVQKAKTSRSSVRLSEVLSAAATVLRAGDVPPPPAIGSLGATPLLRISIADASGLGVFRHAPP